jgi:hypothetical protein
MYDKPKLRTRQNPHWHLIVCVFISPAVDPVLTPGCTDLQHGQRQGTKVRNDPRASLGDSFENALSG